MVVLQAMGTSHFRNLESQFCAQHLFRLGLVTVALFCNRARAYDWVEDIQNQRHQAQEWRLQQQKVNGLMTATPRSYKPSEDCAGVERADDEELAEVFHGIVLKSEFLSACYAQTGRSKYCEQVARSNPKSRKFFYCTYPTSVEATFIHPKKRRWHNAFEAIRILTELEKRDIKVARIYNWWRPEPYNANVGGDPDRHPFGTAVDVLFASKIDQQLAFEALCLMRKEGRIHAVGFYNTAAIHIGVGDPLGIEKDKVWITEHGVAESNKALCSGVGFAN